MRYSFFFILLFTVFLVSVTAESEQMVCEVCVIGGGSGGIGAALAAARSGADVILVEKNNILGGNSTSGYVCRWEPGPGCSFAQEIFDRLNQVADAVGITTRKPTRFGALLEPDPKLTYEDSTHRAGLSANKFHAVIYEPEAFHKVVLEMLISTDRCRVLLETTFMEAETQGKLIKSVSIRTTDGSIHNIRAKVFIDCSGDGYLCRKIGCETMLGEDSRERFNESSAPAKPGPTLNAISLCYRVSKRADNKSCDPKPNNTSGWARSASVHQLPGGDRIVNPLPLLPGKVLIDMGYAKAYETAMERAGDHWLWLKTFSEFEGYNFESFAPMLGIRESQRIVTDYILSQHDLNDGLEGQKHPDIIAIADHPMDTHGEGGGLRGVNAVYGIPYRCLIPKGWNNLLIACRGAGFSHIAASSCRLSRTIMALGHAAGLAAAEAARKEIDVRAIDISQLVQLTGLNIKK